MTGNWVTPSGTLIRTPSRGTLMGNRGCLATAACLLAALLVACQSATPSIVDAPLPRSDKGYELYSWQTNNQWHFTLITGTNRNKTLEEITSGENMLTEDGWVRISVQGVDALKAVLHRLPQQENVFWADNRWPPIHGSNMTLPPAAIVGEIKDYSSQLGLRLNGIDQ